MKRRHAFAPSLVRLEDRRLLTYVAFYDSFGTGSNQVSVEAEAVDAAGDTYLTGNFSGTVSFGATSLTSLASNNVFVAKLDNNGSVLWAVRMGGSGGGDFGRGIALDPTGNPIVTGFYSGNGTFGTTTLTNSGVRDIFVEKLANATGQVLWADGFGGPGLDQGQSVAVDSGGNAYVTGSYQGTVDFGPGFVLNAADASSSDVFVMKVNPAGVLGWARSLGGSGDNSGFGIAVDTNSNAYVTGNFTGSGPFGNFLLRSAGDSDLFVTRLDSGGNVVWAITEGGIGHDDGIAIALDALGNVYTTGDYVGTASFGGIALTSVGQDDAFVQRLDGSGHVIWAKSSGSPGFDAGFGIATDSLGNVYTTGVFQGTARFGGISLTSKGDYDIDLLKTDPNGNSINALDFGSPAPDQAYQVAVGGPDSSVTLVGDNGAGFDVPKPLHPANGSGYVIRLNHLTPLRAIRASNDFDGDGRTDPTIYRQSTGLWVVNGSLGGKLLTTFGDPKQGDIPVPGDYLGIGTAQLAVFRPSTDTFYIQKPDGGTLIRQFGDPAQGDLPVPGDYEGNGQFDLALFRPSQELWIVRYTDGSTHDFQFGDPAHNDLPVPGDYEGIGKYDLALFRPGTGQWIVRTSDGSTPISQFGDPAHGDIPVPGDYDGDGKTDLAIFRPGTALFVIQYSGGGKTQTQLGDPANGDLPVAAPLASLGLVKPHAIKAFASNTFSAASAGAWGVVGGTTLGPPTAPIRPAPAPSPETVTVSTRAQPRARRVLRRVWTTALDDLATELRNPSALNDLRA